MKTYTTLNKPLRDCKVKTLLKLDDLYHVAWMLGLRTHGTRKQLAKRIRNYYTHKHLPIEFG